ncbi:hypothetical protein CEXT_657541 [Caerostris extrusa]|uniref:Uncharacterized protein n=1 Tax=Caerostris extrusa TaxID=172846 RepID=A0AAV4W5W0_CAEEX|nr:hypothetical protein CEXT_657541 [Caerostris extrusa]
MEEGGRGKGGGEGDSKGRTRVRNKSNSIISVGPLMDVNLLDTPATKSSESLDIIHVFMPSTVWSVNGAIPNLPSPTMPTFSVPQANGQAEVYTNGIPHYPQHLTYSSTRNLLAKRHHYPSIMTPQLHSLPSLVKCRDIQREPKIDTPLGKFAFSLSAFIQSNGIF